MNKQAVCFRKDHLAPQLERHTVDYNRVRSRFLPRCAGDALDSRCRTSAPLHQG